MGLLDDDQLRNDFLYQLIHNPRGWRGDRNPYGVAELRGRGPGESRNPYAPMEQSLNHQLAKGVQDAVMTVHPAAAVGTGIGLLYAATRSDDATAQSLPADMQQRLDALRAKQAKNKDGWLPKAEREELISLNRAASEIAVQRAGVEAARQRAGAGDQAAQAAEARRAATPARDLYPWLAPGAAGAGLLAGAGIAAATRGRAVNTYNTAMGRLGQGWKGAVDDGALALNTDTALAARKGIEAGRYADEVAALEAKGAGGEWIKPMALGAAGTDLGLLAPYGVDYVRGGEAQKKAIAELSDKEGMTARLALGGLAGASAGKLASAARGGPMATPNYRPETEGLTRAANGTLLPQVERLGALNRAGLNERDLTQSLRQSVYDAAAARAHSGQVSHALRQYELEALRQKATKGQLDQIQSKRLGGLLDEIPGRSLDQGRLPPPAKPSSPGAKQSSGLSPEDSAMIDFISQQVPADMLKQAPPNVLRKVINDYMTDFGPTGRAPTRAELDKSVASFNQWRNTLPAAGIGLLGLSAAKDEPSLGGLLAP